MDLTLRQTELLERLRSAVATARSQRVVYRSEYLGYLPFGLYHWVTVDDEDISALLPCGFSLADFEAMERMNLLRRVDEWTNPDDELEQRVTFEITGG